MHFSCLVLHRGPGAVFAEMEDEFTRRLLLEKAHDRRIPESTALTWLKRLTKQGALVSVDGKGTYHKN